jgi:hypothetical protein
VRFAIEACRAAAKVMGGSLAAGITFTEEEGGKMSEEMERRALVMPMIIILVAMELQWREQRQ